MDQLTFLPAAPRVSPSASPDSAADWMMTVATWPSSFAALLGEYAPAGSFGKTCPVSFPLSTEGLQEALSCQSSERLKSWGMASHGECSTLNTSEWNHTLVPSRSDGGVCSLSDILETGDVPAQYYLSPKACRGILRRAQARGKTLPEPLRQALLIGAEVDKTQKP